jgi:Membrane proteins related to metalloendopeptidases
MSVGQSITSGFLVFLLFLAGCTVPPNAVSLLERPAQQKRTTLDYHVVQQGETLSSIAHHYGYDYQQLAAWNLIQPPYIIYPGQRLRVVPREGAGAANPPAPARVQKRESAPMRAPVPAGGISAATPFPMGLPSAPTQTPIPARETRTQEASADPKPTTADESELENKAGTPIVWHWPAEGPLLGDFDTTSQVSTGIEIGGNLGHPIRAAASGRVVYSGSGLLGYGKLIIVKHDKTYLSTYGFNKELLVSEGDSVRVGQRIAEMGLNSDRRPALHFEIRRNGEPVNPLRYLPKR